MKAIVVRSFTATLSTGQRMRYAQGDTIGVPDGVDWVAAGLVTPLAETATAEPSETAAKPKPKRRRRKAATK